MSIEQVPGAAVVVALDDPLAPDVVALLSDHLADMRAVSPPESVHALDPSTLAADHITFWTARSDARLLGCAALARLSLDHGEVKSMRTAPASRGRGVATALLLHLLEEARSTGMTKVSLETGSQGFFAPARRLYARHGFEVCGPFGSYRLDPASVFMTRVL